jgi:beta-propeller repeat-containing protein
MDIFVVAFDNLGNVRWKRQIGTSGDEEAIGVTTDGLNDVYVTGSTSGNLFGINQGGADIFVVKLDSHNAGTFGATVWSNQLGSSQTDVGTSVAYMTQPNPSPQNPDGYLFVAGYTFGDLDTNYNLSGGRYSINGSGYNTSDVFLTKFSSTTGLKY